MTTQVLFRPLKSQQVRCAGHSLHWLVWNRGLERAMGVEPKLTGLQSP